MFFNPLPFLMLPIGLYLLFKLRFFYILHPVRSLSIALGSLRSKENLSSFALALAGTLGVGNLLGVAVGITVGGAGSVLWLLLSAIPASVIKYCEVTLAAESGGGMYYTVRRSFSRLGKPLSALYALFCLSLALVMGAALQTKSIIGSLESSLDIEPVILAAVLSLIVFISIWRGADKIGKITLYAIPLTTIIYIILAITLIFANISRLSYTVSMIISDAFSADAALGGALGFVFSRAIREGFARGMLSNEAGAGTSTLAHASGSASSPAEQGMRGVLEVIFDTAILCMLSGLAILLAVPDFALYESGLSLLLAAFGSLGGISTALLLLSILMFGYSTVICWYYYGESCIMHLTGRSGGRAFALLYLAFVLSGAFISEWLLVLLSDIALLALTLLTLPTVIKSSDRVLALSENSGFIKVKKSKESDP